MLAAPLPSRFTRDYPLPPASVGLVSGQYDLAHAASALGLTRARITQIMNLLLLAPEIQEEIFDLPPATNGRDPVSERLLRPIAAEPDWEKQTTMWRKIRE